MKLPATLVKFVLPCAAALSLASCSSIVHGTKQSLKINSDPGGARVVVEDLKKGNKVVFSGTTPCTALVNRGAGFFKGASYLVVVSKPGYDRFETQIDTHVSGWYAGNLGFGGIIGFLIVDPATGGMYSLNRNEISADLRKKHYSFFFPQEGLRVVLRSQVPEDLAGFLKPVSKG